MYPETQYSVEYFPELSPDFKEKLQKIVNEIIKTGLTEFPPPEIEFTGQNKTSLRALKELLNLYTSK
uniref:Uncharacterized protein n=1 Tax=Panagrolaimus davidi TaxID=227884 RepID=A0A914PLI7_9BILA